VTVHEDFSRSADLEGASDRSFGIAMAAFFALIAILPALHGPPSSIRWWATALAAVFLAFALLWSEFLRPLNRLWQKLGLFLSKIASPVVLLLVFFAVVTPVGLLMRALGKDPLRLRRNASPTYWVTRQPPGPEPVSMENQF
jgi:Saxitoxin biosynthesis operon protein SxtJ